MSVIPCQRNPDFRRLILEFSEVLRTESHTLGAHGLTEVDFYQGGLFRGSIERIRGQFSSTMRVKRGFMQLVLNHMQDQGFITEWFSAGGKNRHDYSITLPGGRVSVVELKGCLDGNNTNIFERPAHANEFIIWSVCSNQGADPERNVWSGIHTRLSAEIIEKNKQVDGLVVWDWLCGTVGRPCPKIALTPQRVTVVGQYQLTPPCIYVFPATVPSVRNNPRPVAQDLASVHLLEALHRCFLGRDEEVNYVDFEVEHDNDDTVRKTRVRRNGVIVKETERGDPIRRQ